MNMPSIVSATCVFILAACGGVNRAQADPTNTTVVFSGDTSYGAGAMPPGLTNVVALAAGEDRSLVLNADGSVISWGGYFLEGPTNLPPDLTNITAISLHQYQYLALRNNGRVLGWGDYGSVGGDDLIQAGITNGVAVAAGGEFNLVLKADGTLVGWGPFMPNRPLTAQFSNVVAIASGDSHCLALRGDGSIVAWGSNSSGQTNVPAGLSHVVALAAGANYSLALKDNGTVVGWGDDSAGQIDIPAGLTNVMSISGGDSFALALKSDGTVVGWGSGYLAAGLPSNLTNVTAIAAGGRHCLALTGGGAPFLTSVPAARTAVRGATVELFASATGAQPVSYQWQLGSTILAGATNSVLILTNVQPEQAGGYSVSVGNAYGQAVSPATMLTVLGLEITAQPEGQQSFIGENVTLSVGVAGVPPYYYQWQFNGADLPNQTGDLLVLTNVQTGQIGVYSVVVSNAYTSVTSAPAMLYISQYQVKAWGTNVVWGSDVPQDLDLVSIGAGFYFYMALKSDGTLVSWGPNNSLAPPAGLTNVTSFSAGLRHALALRSDNSVVGWGLDGYGQTDIPANLTNAVALSAGSYHSLALRADGTVSAWGDNDSGQTQIPPSLTNVVAIAAGGYHNLALLAGGTVVAWGDDSSGQIDVPAGLTNVVAISAGDGSSLALKADGTVVAWGDDYTGETSVPAGLTNVLAIAAGAQDSMALLANGTIVSWGDYGRAQSLVPVDMTNVVAIASGNGANLALLGSGPAFLTSRLVNRSANAGAKVAFRATAVGTVPLAYSWRLNGKLLPQATNAVLSLDNVQPSQAGAYSVTVSNSLGQSVSATPSILSIVSPVSFTALPASVTTNAWSTVTFGVAATSAHPITYQWFWNNLALTNGGRVSGAHSALLTITSVQPSDNGNYVVVATAAGVSITSAPPAVLTVPQPSRPVIKTDTIHLGADGRFQFTLGLDPGSHFEILASTNFVDWLILTNTVSAGATFPFFDATTLDHRFYRAELVQP